MKKAAKGLGILLVMTMCMCMFTSCAENVYESYKKAYDNTSALSDLDIKLAMKLNMEIGGSNLQVLVDGACLQSGDETLMDMNMEVFGQEMITSSYLKDGVLYTQSGDMKIKQEQEAQDYEDKDMTEMLEFTEDLFKDIKFEDVKDGKKVSVTASGEKFKEELLKQLDMANELLAGEMNDENISLSDIKAYMIISDDYIKEYNIEFDMNLKMEMEGAAMECKASVSINMILNNPGEKVVIKAPEDLNEYKTQEEYTSGLLGDADINGLTDEIMELFDENFNFIGSQADIDKLYEKYGKETVDTVLNAYVGA